MTKTYTKPDLIIHGNVEEITLATGNSSERDFFIFTGLPAGVSTPDPIAAQGSKSLESDIVREVPTPTP
ncbi:MAG: lasso peptide [Moorea sp. SIO2I5]|nr:lasso peptide [Moorena sp. SIO2I5]